MHSAAAGADAALAGPAAESPEVRRRSRGTRRAVRRVVDGLPAALREVLILNSFEELGYEEIARVLDIPVGTVSSRIYAARRKLAARLPKLGTTSTDLEI